MANATTLPGDLVVPGVARLTEGISPLLAPNKVLAVSALQSVAVPMTAWRKWDAYATPLTASPATDDLGLIGGTFGTSAPTLQTDDLAANGAPVSYYARAEIEIPHNYIAAGSAKIRVHAGMLTTIADQDATVDVVAYLSDKDETVTGDLVTDAPVANNMNSIASPFAVIDFALTATSLTPGAILDVRIHVSGDDNGAAGVIKGCVAAVELLVDVR